MNFVTRAAISLFAFAGLASLCAAQCDNCPERRTISVNGAGVVTADADHAVIHVGYKLYGSDAKSAYESAVETSNAVMDALTGSGIPKADIESTSQVLTHTELNELNQLPLNNDERARMRFTVTQSWTIRAKPDDAAKALNTAVAAGANESGWIQWIVDDPARLEAEASAKALANAHTIAEQLAQQSGVHLGHLVSASQNQGPFSIDGSFEGGLGGGIPIEGVQVGNQRLAINSRRIEFKMTIYAVYSIE